MTKHETEKQADSPGLANNVDVVQSPKEPGMVNYISGLLFVVLLLVGAAIIIPIAEDNPANGVIFGILWLLGDIIIASAIRLAAQWERAVIFRVGKLSGIKGPGLFMIIPLIDQLRMVDIRV